MSNDTELLASLGPLMGLAKVSRGEMSTTAYLERYGHRGPHELELSFPRPSEESAWLDRQLAHFRQSSPDVEQLIADQRERFASAWHRFVQKDPAEEKSVRKRVTEVARRARLREEVRSEYVRVFAVWRLWALQAGRLAGVGEDVFFLSVDEVLARLDGRQDSLRQVDNRKEAYARYKSLPPYPSVIIGRFDPFEWAADLDRQQCAFDVNASEDIASTNAITGTAGSAGRVEGVVRCLASPEEGDQLQPGEILVTSQTNIGWTLSFPIAAAIITDVGAPLSHAAILARELGIPAVVGCGTATKRLKTVDRVKVDGAQGVVEILLP